MYTFSDKVTTVNGRVVYPPHLLKRIGVDPTLQTRKLVDKSFKPKRVLLKQFARKILNSGKKVRGSQGGT